MFVDETEIQVEAGDGGDGIVSFHRERHNPRGGPDGGDGGRGGNVILRATNDYRTLGHLKNQGKFSAGHGENGGANERTGANGDDCIIDVPVGTIVRDHDHGHVLKDLTEDGQELLVAKGGEGGTGNAQFKSSTNQAPRKSTCGEDGERRKVSLELKLLADVGLIGLPNAGKSTLLSTISDAHPRTASYPFTTMYPVVGIVKTDTYRSFTVADLPGLIEGAHEGKGLGDRFLKHIERTGVLVHLVDVSPQAAHPPLESVDILRSELSSYSEKLARKPELVVANKIDVEGTDRRVKELHEKLDVPVIAVSAITEQGLERLKHEMLRLLEKTNSTDEDSSSVVSSPSFSS